MRITAMLFTLKPLEISISNKSSKAATRPNPAVITKASISVISSSTDKSSSNRLHFLKITFPPDSEISGSTRSMIYILPVPRAANSATTASPIPLLPPTTKIFFICSVVYLLSSFRKISPRSLSGMITYTAKRPATLYANRGNEMR